MQEDAIKSQNIYLKNPENVLPAQLEKNVQTAWGRLSSLKFPEKPYKRLWKEGTYHLIDFIPT